MFSRTSRKITGMGHGSPQVQGTRDRVQLLSFSFPPVALRSCCSPNACIPALGEPPLLSDVCSVQPQALSYAGRERRYSHRLQSAKLGEETRGQGCQKSQWKLFCWSPHALDHCLEALRVMSSFQAETFAKHLL